MRKYRSTAASVLALALSGCGPLSTISVPTSGEAGPAPSGSASSNTSTKPGTQGAAKDPAVAKEAAQLFGIWLTRAFMRDAHGPGSAAPSALQPPHCAETQVFDPDCRRMP